jgi:AmmeMemoRadiSam system protein A
MAPISSTENSAAAFELTATQQRLLLQLARESISYGLDHGRAIEVDVQRYDEPLRRPAATFVTLHKSGDLRGCIGALQPYQPLVSDVAEHAYAAAFNDPRFAPLRREELDAIVISISVLGPPQAVEFTDEEQLIAQLRPAVDGLILEEGRNRGTFLPSVWETLPQPRQFLQQLKRKAGLPADYWSESLRVSRYTTHSFSEMA